MVNGPNWRRPTISEAGKAGAPWTFHSGGRLVI